MLVASALSAYGLVPAPAPPSKVSSDVSLTSPDTVGRVVPTSLVERKPVAKGPRKASWLPGSYAPPYLDGSLPGDVGFDPYALVALAPTQLSVDDGRWKSVALKSQMVMCSAYEAKRKVMWMREAEVTPEKPYMCM